MVLDNMPDSVQADLERLREDWGSLPLSTEHNSLPAEPYEDTTVPDDAVFRFASAWVRREESVLLVKPTGDEGWASPGGRQEPGESFEATARRETREETGATCQLRDVIDVRLTLTEYGDRATIPSMGVVFDADYTGGEIRPQPSEIDAVDWFSELPAEEDLVFESVTEYPL